MAIVEYNRNRAGRRNMSIVRSKIVSYVAKPIRSLLAVVNKKSGRAGGKISVRHRGGGNKRKYRVIDFRQIKFGVEGKIVQIERDPNRSAFIALVFYADGDKKYILATEDMKVGSSLLCGESAPVAPGNRMPLKNIPSGYFVCNVEMFPGKGGQMARSAGSKVQLMGFDDKYAQLKLTSGETRLINKECYATIGKVSNFEHGSIRVGKAGKSRHLGRRPTVRGSAMNPVDHPHGGGEGRQPIGLKYPKTPWGRPALGKKTRKKKNISNRFILARRSKKR
ncbi:MAG: 50S ribosomal protein L2 [Candidatus Moraniibacteriota bacterium]|nr:MAG: 50S ribosomal protein L2 [Candidatus Moranbacteria bacterium]